MTAPAPTAAPASGPIAPTAPRAPSKPSADRLGFAAVLDSLPGGAAEAGPSTAEKQARLSDEPRQDRSPPGQPAGMLSDGALLATLPFALQAASMAKAPEGGDQAPSLAPAAMKGPGAEDSGVSGAAGAKAATAARLISERAFHFGPSAIAGRTIAIDSPFAPAGADLSLRADPSGEGALAAGFPPAKAVSGVNAVPGDNTPAAASIALHAGGAPTNRVSPIRSATHDAARSGRKPEAATPPPAVKAASSTAAAAPAESSPKAADGRLPDPTASVAQPTAQADPFSVQLSAPFVAASSFGPDGSTRRAVDIAPRASALAAGPAPSARPVREIDVDLSPGGLEDVSMTMRLAGEKLSVVIRAASFQTLSSIEGARDAIADRLAAIGQPLDSLIVKQTVVNADGNTNGNTASADDGSAGEKWRSAHGAGERGGSNDANLSRRGAGRDRTF
jgi:hypothetical protein